MSEPLSTIAQALAWAIGQLCAASKTPRLDAELLLAHILGWSRARVLAESRAPLSSAQQTGFGELIARRAALEPVAYLVGHKEFYGLDFLVDRRVLVPRPETELLVELTLEYAKTKNQGPSTAGAHLADDLGFSVLGARSLVADIGTGSGCIAVALAVHLPKALVYATDISPQALQVARRNVERHAVAERVRLVESDLVAGLPEPVDLLVSNPPYTILSEIDEGVQRYEPHLALDGGADGLTVYGRLLAAASSKLRPGGAVLLEIGATQGAAVVELARSHAPAAHVELHQDLAGLDRVVTIAFPHRYAEQR